MAAPVPAEHPGRAAAEVVRLLGGAGRWQEIVRRVPDHELRLAVREGLLRRPARGVYTLPDPPLATAVRKETRGVLSHQSAAAYWQLEGFGPAPQVHVTVPRTSRARSRRGVAVHYADLDPVDEDYGVTSVLRTVLDCAATLPFAEALAVADSALRRDLVGREALVRRAEVLQGKGSRGSRQRLAVARAADGRAASPHESALRSALITARIGGFEPQTAVELDGYVAHVDLGDARRRIALEADSFRWHATPEAFARDCGRYNDLVVAGWLVLRFAWDHAVFEPERVARTVRDAARRPAVRRPGSGRVGPAGPAGAGRARGAG